MSVREDDDFELVLGNRQLFFLAVVLFGVFFSIGYTVGYSRGHESADEVSAATRQPERTAQPAPLLTPPAGTAAEESLAEPAAGSDSIAPMHDSSESAGLSAGTPGSAAFSSPANPKPQPTRSATTAPNTAASRPPSVASTRPASATTSAPPARGAASEPRAGTRSASSPATPSSRQAASVPQATIAVPAVKPGAIYLQVLASKEADPAREALIEMREKGHPVTLDNSEPEWYRILIGPFEEQENAAQYQVRLKTEGIDSFIRKL